MKRKCYWGNSCSRRVVHAILEPMNEKKLIAYTCKEHKVKGYKLRCVHAYEEEKKLETERLRRAHGKHQFFLEWLNRF